MFFVVVVVVSGLAMASIIFQSTHNGQFLYYTIPSQAALNLFISTCLLSRFYVKSYCYH